MERDHPLTIVVAGATGDLFRRKLVPSLAKLFELKRLPEDFRVYGFSRKNLSREEWENIIEESSDKCFAEEEHSKEFVSRFEYFSGDITKAEIYESIKKVLDLRDGELGVCANKLFYLALSPDLYDDAFRMLGKSGLTIPCAPEFGKNAAWVRLLVEKPFGTDREHAKKLDELLGSLFDEDQIFRIDHYLAKDTAQKILVFRFANRLFEDLWSSNHVEKIIISAHESHVAGMRAVFYDKTGALHDFGQNHLLSLLSLVCSERPDDLNVSSIRKSRANLLAHVRVANAWRGQYEGYRGENGVPEDSTTETYFRALLEIHNDRFKGVPVILSHGKGFDETKACVEIIFKRSEDGLFDAPNNRLAFAIQPEEKIVLSLNSKAAGFSSDLVPFEVGEIASVTHNPFLYPYQRLIYDALIGDQTLFVSTEELEESWRIAEEVKNKMCEKDLIVYSVGSDPRAIL